MGDVATPHRTLPVEVMITAPVTTANRGEVARWLEDRGIGVAVPHHEAAAGIALIVDADRCIGDNFVPESHRLVFDGRRAQPIDAAHYKLWYEPIERTEP